MIHVHVLRDKKKNVYAFEMSGHAEYAEHGKDLVCAGASAVSFGAVNALFALTDIEPEISQGEEGGYLRVDIPKEASTNDRVQTILQTMIISLQTIERDYREHIKITFK